MNTIPAIQATSTPLRYFLRWLRARWHVCTIGLGAVMLTDVAELAFPKFVQYLIDDLRGSVAQNVALWAWAILATLFAQYVCRLVWRISIARESSYAAASLKLELWKKVRRLPLARFIHELTPGVVMNLAASDVGTARMLFGWTLVQLVDCIVMSCAGLVLMLTLDPVMSCAAIACLCVLPFLLRRLTTREYDRHTAAQEVLALLNERCAQAAGSLRLSRLTGTERVWERRALEAAADYRMRRLAEAQTAFQFGLSEGLVHALSLSVLLVLGAWRFAAGAVTLGELVALQSYLALLQGPLGDLGVVLSEWQRGIASLQRLLRILSADDDARYSRQSRVAATPAPNTPVVELRALELQRSAGNPLAAAAITLDVRPGERIGIQGRVGSGKTLLLETIAGLRERGGGEVRLLGADIDKLAPSEIHRLVTIVPQQSFIFADTVRANVALDRTVSDADIWRVLEVAGLAGEVRGFPGGLDAPLGEWGINLSGGQRQRLTLARALAARPAVLLLDDCLSAVDPLAEAHIFDSLSRELSATAVLWAGHRPSALAHCTRILRLAGQ